jgi:hypothetical protein
MFLLEVSKISMKMCNNTIECVYTVSLCSVHMFFDII